MARFLILWRASPTAPWPTDLAESAKLQEKMWAGIDDSIKKGTIKEFGYFLDGTSGYAISEGEGVNVFRGAIMFVPYVEFEIHEIIPYETGKENVRAVWKVLAEAMK